MKKILFFIILSQIFFQAMAYTDGKSLPVDVYSTIYEITGSSGSIKYQKQGQIRQTSLSSVSFDLLKPKITENRKEDRLLVKFHFDGIDTVVEAALKWEKGKYILNRKEEEPANHSLNVGINFLQDRISLFRYIMIEDHQIEVKSSAQGIIESIDIQWKDDKGRAFSDWMGVDIDRVYEIRLHADFKKEAYIVRGEGRTKYTIPELRFYNSRPVLATINNGLKQKVIQDPQKYLPELVQALLKGQTDDGIKMVILADWIADNIYYDQECFHDGQNWCDTDAYGTLKNTSTVCEGYAQLFKEMARIAGLPVISSGGYVYGGAVYGTVKLSRHAWNLVRLNDQWYLYDVTHNSHNSLSKGKFTYAGFDNSHTLMNMEKVGVKYYPDKALYQFIPQPQTFEEYKKNLSSDIFICNVQQKFFDLGLSLSSPLPYEISISNQPYLIELNGPSGINLSLTYNSQSLIKGQDNFFQYNPAKKSYELYFYPPSRHDYSVFINASLPGKDWNTILSLRLSGQETLALSPGLASYFPKKYWDFNENQVYLAGPLQGTLNRNKPYTFRIYVPGTQKVRLYWNGTESHVDFEQISPEWFELKDFKLPQSSEVRIFALLPGITYYKALLSYQVR